MSNIGRKLGLTGMTTSGFFHDNSVNNTEFKYPGFHKTQFVSMGTTTIQEDMTTVGKENSARFIVHQDVHAIGEITLCGKFLSSADPILDNGTNATINNRLINYAPREQIDYIEFKAGKSAKRPVRISGRSLHVEHYITTIDHELVGIEKLELGGMTDAERGAAYQTEQNWKVTLKTPWDDLRCHLPLNALQDDLIIEVFFKPSSAILCYDGIVAAANKVVREDMYLRIAQFMFFTPAYEYNYDGMFNEEGIVYYKRDVEFYDTLHNFGDIVKGNRIEIPLRDINHEVTAFFVTIRYANHVDSAGDHAILSPGGIPRGNYGYDILQPWVEHEIRDNNMIIDEAVDFDFQKWCLNVKNLMYPPGENILCHLNGLALLDRKHAYGSYNPSGYSQGVFSITLTDDMITEMRDNNENILIEFTCLVHNKVSLVARNIDRLNPRAVLVELFQIV